MINQNIIKRILATVIPIFVFILLLPYSLTLPQHGDEKMYVWKSAYYSELIVNLDFRPQGEDPYRDPGFSQMNFWTVEQPFGTHLIYGFIIQVAQLSPPDEPFSWVDENLQGPNSQIPHITLIILRLVAILCAAIGSGLIILRFGYPGAISIIIFFLIPSSGEDLARAWAEGPLLLGFGLCAISYRTRWFPVACGTAAAIKLTALGLWPLMIIPGALGKKNIYYWYASIPIALIVWSILTPVSLFATGPLYILPIVVHRIAMFISQSIHLEGNKVFGVFFPSRYAWPFILLGLIVITRQIISYIPNLKSKF